MTRRCASGFETCWPKSRELRCRTIFRAASRNRRTTTRIPTSRPRTVRDPSGSLASARYPNTSRKHPRRAGSRACGGFRSRRHWSVRSFSPAFCWSLWDPLITNIRCSVRSLPSPVKRLRHRLNKVRVGSNLQRTTRNRRPSNLRPHQRSPRRRRTKRYRSFPRRRSALRWILRSNLRIPHPRRKPHCRKCRPPRPPRTREIRKQPWTALPSPP